MEKKEREYPTSAQVGPPNLSGLASDFTWRPTGNGWEEMVRKSDGHVLGRRKVHGEPVRPGPKPAPMIDEPKEMEPEAVVEVVQAEEGEPMANDEPPDDVDLEEIAPALLHAADDGGARRMKRSRMNVGDRFGRLTLIEGDAPPGKGRFKCDCGVVTEKFRNVVKKGQGRCGFDCALGPYKEGEPKRASAAKPGPAAAERGSKPAAARSNGAAASKAADRITAVAALPVIDVERFARRLDALMRLTLDIDLEHVESMIAEIERRETGLPEGGWGRLNELRSDLAEAKRKATAFLEYRKAIGELE